MEKAIKEIRIAEMRALDSEEMIIEGYAAVFNQETDLGWCKEVIDIRAFDECDMKDCCLNYNHGQSKAIARTRNGSLELIVDSVGLKIRAKLIDTTEGIDIYKSVKAGLLDKMSFAFTVKEEKWDYDTDTRTITNIDKLYDVSIVDIPAYEGTSVFARNKEEYQEDKEKYLKAKSDRRRLELKLSLLSL
ncbi:MAG: HK97 family phage prohead protease [Clostridia bacterium]|nr:HK97 family phage prohead protease [Clostridia bacterium]